MKRSVITVLLLLAALPVAAWQYQSLSGQYRIAGKTVIDPPPSEAKDTHLHLTLSGAAARDLYNAMKVAPKPDECAGNGATIKTVGAMQCLRSEDGKEYECSFAIDIANQTIMGASVC
ncbi:hypothetical protein [Nitrosomonas sp. wSCUT-2]